MSQVLSREAREKIDKMVERVARKAGYTGRENMTYKEIIQAKFEQKREKMARKLDKYRRKFSLKPSNTDFAEEIRTYLQDGLVDLMNEGHSEDEAIAMTMAKFDEAELSHEGFDEFVEAFGGFGMKDYQGLIEWGLKNYEAIGLFYAAFFILGTVGGTLCGYLSGHTWFSTLFGTGIGLFAGIGFGLLSHAIIAMTKER